MLHIWWITSNIAIHYKKLLGNYTFIAEKNIFYTLTQRSATCCCETTTPSMSCFALGCECHCQMYSRMYRRLGMGEVMIAYIQSIKRAIPRFQCFTNFSQSPCRALRLAVMSPSSGWTVIRYILYNVWILWSENIRCSSVTWPIKSDWGGSIDPVGRNASGPSFTKMILNGEASPPGRSADHPESATVDEEATDSQVSF